MSVWTTAREFYATHMGHLMSGDDKDALRQALALYDQLGYALAYEWSETETAYILTALHNGKHAQVRCRSRALGIIQAAMKLHSVIR